MTEQVWRMHGRLYHLHLWSPSEWERLPPAERPATAFECEGRGWADVLPLEGAGPTTPPGSPGTDPTSSAG